MKTKLNLTIESTVLSDIKAYASNKHIGISELVENYFRHVVKPAKRKNILTLIDKLEKPVIDKKADLKEEFYKQQANKHGF